MMRAHRVVSLALAASAVFAAVSVAQVEPARKFQVGPRLQVNPAKIEVLRRPKLAFTPFPLRDPNTGRSVSRETMIRIPETNKRIPAGKYYDQLNQLEKGFTDLGYSLRTSPKELKLQRSRIDRLALVRKGSLIRSEHLRFDPNRMFRPRSLLDFRNKNVGAITKTGRVLPGLIKTESQPFYDKSFRYEEGDPEIFTAFVRGGLKAEGTKDIVKVSGDLALGGTMFEKSADVLKMTGSLNSPPSGTMKGRVELLFLGFTIHSYNKDTAVPFTYDSDFSKGFREKIVPIQFMLGPVPMTGEVGIFGNAGVKYGISLAPLDAKGLLAPYANVGVYAEIGTGIDIVSVGVGADLILIEDRIELVGEASVEDSATAQPYLLLAVHGTNVMEMLAGRVYFFVKIPVPKLTPPFYEKKKYDWEVFDWEGLKVEGVLFNHSKRVNL